MKLGQYSIINVDEKTGINTHFLHLLAGICGQCASTSAVPGNASTTLAIPLNTAGYNILGSGSISGSMGAGYISTGIFGFNSTQGYYSFKNGATDIMYIDATNARVGIGTTGPSQKLEVQGDAGIIALNHEHNIFV